MQLAVLILLVVLFATVVRWVGTSVLTSCAFALYAPVFLKSSHARQRSLKHEILRNKAELQATSSQDEFAKWAKLRRRVDKGLSELEAINAAVASDRARFERAFSGVLYALTSGLQWVIVWWYRREPAFWLPAGWMPRGLEWLLSFGGGPRGSVSVTIWSIVCKKVFDIVESSVRQWVSNPFVGSRDTPAVPVAGAEKS